jgi:DNA (cytosine-5)-methyltransferase 1
MRYLSVCSGIEAATVAFRPLGWEAVAFSEINPFCNALLQHYYPEVPNLGDITHANCKEKFDILVGGTPCQSFSAAGHRRGLDDERGQLVWHYIRLLGDCRPKWFIWENVCGLLRLNGGAAFKKIISAFVDCGYSVCWRVLDGRDFQTPQPRERCFVVGYYGKDWRPPAAVLLEPESDSWNNKICEETKSEDTRLVKTLSTKNRLKLGQDMLIPITRTLTSKVCGREMETLIPCLFNSGSAGWRIYDTNSYGQTLSAMGGGAGAKTGLYLTVAGVRRLTPLESERYMGFPDGYTKIMYRGKPASDPRRYEALGNSIIPAKLRWIGERIQEVEGEIL